MNLKKNTAKNAKSKISLLSAPFKQVNSKILSSKEQSLKVIAKGKTSWTPPDREMVIAHPQILDTEHVHQAMTT